MATVGRAEVTIVADARGFARDAEREINNALRRVDVDTRKIDRDIKVKTRRSFLEAGRAAVTQLGIVLQGGISRSAAGAFGVALLALLGPAMLIVGTTLGGLIITGLGSALAGIGVFFAAQNEAIQAQFAGTFQQITGELRIISRPFEQTLFEIVRIWRDLFFDEFADPMARAFEELAPAIATFAEFLGEAFAALAPTIEPLTEAFIQILEELGPTLATEVFPDLADAIINLAEAIGDNADLFADLLSWFLSAPEAIINFLAELTRFAAWFADNKQVITAFFVAAGVAILAFTTGPFGIFVAAIIGLGGVVVTNLEKIKQAFGAARDFLGNLLGTLARWFANTWNGIVGNVSSAVDRIQRFGRNLAASFGRLRRDIVNTFNNVVSFIRGLPGRIASAAAGMWNGIWNSFRNAINRIIDGWNRLSFTVPGVSVPFVGTFGGFTVGTPNIPRLQRGGMIERAGVVEVGEAGRELVFLPQAAAVSPLPAPTAPAEPREFTATAVIDLGNGIRQAIELVFTEVIDDARAAA